MKRSISSTSTLEESVPLKKNYNQNAYKSELSSTSLQSSVEVTNDRETSDDCADFFVTIQSEIDKINKFFTGKAAEFHVTLDDILQLRRNNYRSHHNIGDCTSI